MIERDAWNELYRRAIARRERPPAEVDSVPVPQQWGTLPAHEWEAQAFLQPCLARSRRWLDIGCGTGSVVAAFLRRHPHATALGIDISDVAIAHGRSQLAPDGELTGRLRLSRGDPGDAAVAAAGPFDMVLALFSLQFLRPAQFGALLSTLGESLLARPGIFAGTVRSTSRSVPNGYVPLEGEPNCYVSNEPHEKRMIYHHYAREEIEEAARRLGGRIAHLNEVFSVRDYDPAPRRAWWNFVIVLG